MTSGPKQSLNLGTSVLSYHALTSMGILEVSTVSIHLTLEDVLRQLQLPRATESEQLNSLNRSLEASFGGDAYRNFTPLHWAAGNGDLAVRRLIRVTNKWSGSEFGCVHRPLSITVPHTWPRCVQHIASLDLLPQALSLAPAHPHPHPISGPYHNPGPQATAVLLDAGAEVNALDGQRKTPLCHARINRTTMPKWDDDAVERYNRTVALLEEHGGRE